MSKAIDAIHIIWSYHQYKASSLAKEVIYLRLPTFASNLWRLWPQCLRLAILKQKDKRVMNCNKLSSLRCLTKNKMRRACWTNLESAKVSQNFDLSSTSVMPHSNQIASVCVCGCRSSRHWALAPFANVFSWSIRAKNSRRLKIIIWLLMTWDFFISMVNMQDQVKMDQIIMFSYSQKSRSPILC